MRVCPDATSLSDLVNGLLIAESAKRLRSHVNACAACLQVIAALLAGYRRHGL